MEIYQVEKADMGQASHADRTRTKSGRRERVWSIGWEINSERQGRLGVMW